MTGSCTPQYYMIPAPNQEKRSLVWYEKRTPKANYQALPGVQRTAPGNDCRQRGRDQKAPALRPDDYQEDNLYHQSKVIHTMIVYPCLRIHLPERQPIPL